MNTITHTDTLIVEECCNCGIAFAMPKDFQLQRRNDKGRFFCPNGHGQSYTRSTEQILRQQLEDEKRYRQWDKEKISSLSHELQHQKYKTMAERSAKARLKKRIAAGTCPCCKRTFSNMARHIAHQHPNYRLEQLEAASRQQAKEGR